MPLWKSIDTEPRRHGLPTENGAKKLKVWSLQMRRDSPKRNVSAFELTNLIFFT
jgi:hypothetical protein